MQKHGERRIAQFDRFAFLVLHIAECQIDVVQLAEGMIRGFRHLALHREQFFFAGTERVRLVSQQAFETKPMRGQFGSCEKFFHLDRRNGEDLRPDKAGDLAGLTARMLKAADHALVGAVAVVFGHFQMSVRAEPFAGPIEFVIEFQSKRPAI